MTSLIYSCSSYTKFNNLTNNSNKKQQKPNNIHINPSSFALNLTNSRSKSPSKIRLWKKYKDGNSLRNVEVNCKENDGENGVFLFKDDENGEEGKYRYKVVCLVAMVMCLLNANRIVMSVAVVPLSLTHAWSTSFVGIVQSSFLWGYIVSSVIGGAMADKFGGARVMAWGVGFWSLATFLTPWAADLSATTLLVVRAFFGLAQGVAIPSMNIILSRWFPVHERARAVGISLAGFQLGNVLGLCVTPNLITLTGISGPFVLFSSLGLLWLLVWSYGVTNDPKESRFMTNSELQLIQAGKANLSVSNNAKVLPVRLLLSKWPSWAIIFANFTNNWGYFVLLSWMPIYFKTVLGVNLKEAAWFSAVPWGVMAVSSYAAGATSDYLIKAGYALILVRKIMQSIGFVGPGLSLLCLNYATTPGVASVILTIALSFSAFSQAGYLLNIQDIAPQSVGRLHGISNAAGTFAAIISTIGTGYFVEWLGSFKAFLILTAMLYFVSTVFYNLHATGERIV
ncbi:putative anion transporter 3, chloroplastic [Silene latifolia]|uniref:putative anion transporter 3, chloroplastic n=1 Tax=Silene latifolia TaxID=37657 RepID=UPI003D779B84